MAVSMRKPEVRCDWCEKRLREEVIIEEDGRTYTKEEWIEGVVRSPHISIGQVFFCGNNHADEYWKDREIFMPKKFRDQGNERES